MQVSMLDEKGQALEQQVLAKQMSAAFDGIAQQQVIDNLQVLDATPEHAATFSELAQRMQLRPLMLTQYLVNLAMLNKVEIDWPDNFDSMEDIKINLVDPTK